MIFIGYQGIGKSTLSRQNSGYIDLESSNFRINGIRPEGWEVMYCDTAIHLSQQGYNVFVSSHQKVRDYLGENCINLGLTRFEIAIVHPDLSLKDVWIKKLKDRYESTQSAKDGRALFNAIDRYSENISELTSDAKKYGFSDISLEKIDYYLKRELSIFQDKLADRGPYWNKE